ncbi:DUF3105 domain-containing protein [Actinomadura adrarensis]|uniref:DUF3105 domain-containing protein n=1 Tax=Actinomadura adrarensis TaxID=1819600 RepID=A0ABW3CL27_9ACTN
MSKSARNRAQRRPNALTERTVPWGAIAFFTVIGIIVVAAIGWAFLQSRPDEPAGPIAGLIKKDGLSQNHTSATVRYETNPPMGGDHDPVWQNCDGIVYDKQLRNENAVHSLEHGAVWFTYQPNLASDQVDKLKDKVEGTDYTFMSPYPNQDSPIVLTAWGHQLKVSSADDARIDQFLRTYVKGEQTPEPGAACNGAKATP